jgi:hypothetical protein
MNTKRAISIDRREFARVLAAAGVAVPVSAGGGAAPQVAVSADDVRIAAGIAGEHVAQSSLEALAAEFSGKLEQFQMIRDFEISDSIEPAPIFVMHSGETIA